MIHDNPWGAGRGSPGARSGRRPVIHSMSREAKGRILSPADGRCGRIRTRRLFDFGLVPVKLVLRLEAAERPWLLSLLRRPLAQGAWRVEGPSGVEGYSGRTPSLHSILPAQAAGQGARTRPAGPIEVEGRCGKPLMHRPFDFGLVPGQLDLHQETAWRTCTRNVLRRPLAQGAWRV